MISDLLEELTVILTVIWLNNLERERLSVSKRTVQKFDLEKFNVQMLYDVEVKDQYHVKISNMFLALENLDDNVDISRI
jgi:hypothetical protein